MQSLHVHAYDAVADTTLNFAHRQLGCCQDFAIFVRFIHYLSTPACKSRHSLTELWCTGHKNVADEREKLGKSRQEYDEVAAKLSKVEDNHKQEIFRLNSLNSVSSLKADYVGHKFGQLDDLKF